MSSRVIIAAAGGGKTTRIVQEAIGDPGLRTALVTYTQNNVGEIESQIYAARGAFPPHIEVISWFRFLLHELARPYRNALHAQRIDGLAWTEQRSAKFVKEAETAKFYFAGGRLVYSDKISQFICKCDEATGGAVMKRLSQRFGHIYIDEVQDLHGYDLELLELMLKAGIRLTLVGDHRQATYATNQSPKNSAFAGAKIVDKFVAWEKKQLLTIAYEQESHRCQQPIVDLADSFYPNEPKTVSKNGTKTGHDGVFAIPSALVTAYMERYQPQVLRLDVRTACHGNLALNFGASKGLTFERVLIFPHAGGLRWLTSGKMTHVEKSAAKMYVGITRARHSVTFVLDKPLKVDGISVLAELPV